MIIGVLSLVIPLFLIILFWIQFEIDFERKQREERDEY